MDLIEIRSKEEHDRYLKENNKAIVVYHAKTWCGHSKRYMQLIDGCKSKLTCPAGAVDESDFKDLEKLKDIAIVGFPTTIGYQDSKEVGRLVGAVSEDELVKFAADLAGK